MALLGGLPTLSGHISSRPVSEEESMAKLSIPCPLCGRRLWASTLKKGENYCPHCFEKFTAE